MLAIAQTIDRVNNAIGFIVAWLTLPMVLIQFSVVVLRYVFGWGSIMAQELIIYLHAFTFMLGAAAVLLRGGHVRVDIFYQGMANRGKAIVDLIGSCVFLLPVSFLILLVSLPVATASWSILEGSKETSGIQAVFLLKSLAIAFSVLFIAQGLSMAIRAVLVLTGVLDTHIVKGAQHNPELPDGAAISKGKS